ncbi:hypothetical protein I6A84_32780, partial [Frankia sp. CNm7]|uniref:hypothetical protein n=1 Tax=Frankia nepalensis TaxID=1836974 RepID=UPI001931D35B
DPDPGGGPDDPDPGGGPDDPDPGGGPDDPDPGGGRSRHIFEIVGISIAALTLITSSIFGWLAIVAARDSVDIANEALLDSRASEEDGQLLNLLRIRFNSIEPRFAFEMRDLEFENNSPRGFYLYHLEVNMYISGLDERAASAGPAPRKTSILRIEKLLSPCTVVTAQMSEDSANELFVSALQRAVEVEKYRGSGGGSGRIYTATTLVVRDVAADTYWRLTPGQPPERAVPLSNPGQNLDPRRDVQISGEGSLPGC